MCLEYSISIGWNGEGRGAILMVFRGVGETLAMQEQVYKRIALRVLKRGE